MKGTFSSPPDCTSSTREENLISGLLCYFILSEPKNTADIPTSVFLKRNKNIIIYPP